MNHHHYVDLSDLSELAWDTQTCTDCGGPTRYTNQWGRPVCEPCWAADLADRAADQAAIDALGDDNAAVVAYLLKRLADLEETD